jgi:uncharacterized protein YggE
MGRTTLLALALTIIALPASAGEAADHRNVSTSGQARIRTVPDMATIRMGVEARRPTVAEARDEVSSVVTRFLALAKDLGIPDNRVATASPQVSPDYQWNPQSRERKLLGYLVTRHITVDLRDLDKLGPLMERSMAVGINQVQPPSFASSRRDEIEHQALAAAAKDAWRRAVVLAQSLDAGLGPVRSIQSHGRVDPMPRMEMMAADAGARGEQTYQPGEIVISASVSATFDLVLE